MSETIMGQLNVQGSSGGNTKIIVDGDTGGVTLRDSQGIDTLLLEGAEGRLFAGGRGHNGHVQLQNEHGDGVTSLDGNGYVYVGGSGQAGNVILRDRNGRDSLALEGAEGRVFAGGGGHSGHIQIQKSDGSAVTSLDANGYIYVGASNVAGNIVLRDSQGNNTLMLEGGEGWIVAGGTGHNGEVQLRNAQEQMTIHLDGQTADLVAGGAGQGGNVTLRNSQGRDRIKFNGETAYVDVGGGDRAGTVALRNTQNNHAISMSADTARISVGDFVTGQAGRIDVWGPDKKRAIQIDGNSGDILLFNADCAEEFDLDEGDAIDPGTVMVMSGNDSLRACTAAYDRKVAGIVSGAGSCRPGIILGRRRSKRRRVVITLIGKAHCKVDATSSSIAVGDLLTTSNTPGHAMKATNPSRAFGAVIGKALQPIKHGTGLIPVLIALQ